jgi:DNA helicase II / ATP-dependent DNA helicase PcrA
MLADTHWKEAVNFAALREKFCIYCPRPYTSAVHPSLSNLNPEQRKAALHKNGPLLILAGAGAGKTKTVTERIVELVRSGVPPHSILAITFTNKAAKEMRERVRHALKSDQSLGLSFGEEPFMSTFHSLGVFLLRQEGKVLGLPRHFTIADRQDALRMIKESLKDLGFDPKQYEPGKILSVISKQKGEMVSVEDYRDKWGGGTGFGAMIAKIWSGYERTLVKEKALDFDDLLLKTYKLLREYPDVLAKYQDTWRYIHIDEYQDTNGVQYGIVKLLAAKHQNLCVVGDIDQNIYSWRGANIQNILSFEEDYPEATVITLEENYRSTQTILSLANAVIAKNTMRREKRLFTRKEGGEKLALFAAHTETEEAHFVAHKSKELIASGVSPSEIAVLYRANFQSRVLEEAFMHHDVPYQLLGTKFFDRKEIKDVLSYIRAALNPDSVSDLKRIINTPARGIGKVTILKLFETGPEGLPVPAQAKVAGFYRILEAIRGKALEVKPSELVKFVIEQSGLAAELSGGGEEDVMRLENMQELATLAHKYDHLPYGEGLEKLLEDAALQSDQDELEKPQEAVKLMTVHAAKGLEFDHVFITGLEEDLFPHAPMGRETKTVEQAEEERRLFYVAVTRARKKLFLCYASVRTIYGAQMVAVPSRFLSDVDEELIEDEKGFEHREKIIYLDL